MIKILKKILFKIIPKKLLIAIVNDMLSIFFLKRWLRNRSIQKGPVTVVGMLRSNSGLGKAARLTLEEFKLLKICVTCFDVSKLFNAYKFSVDLPSTVSDYEGGAIVIQNSAIHLPIILFMLGRKKIVHKKIIGYFAWELEELPVSWIKASRLVDEIWVPSDFVARSFNKIKDMPKVRVVPHPLNVVKREGDFLFPHKIQQYKKKVLNIATLGSQFERKNIIGVIKMFKVLYSGNSDVCLILKLSGYNLEQQSLLKHAIRGAKNIFLIKENLSEKELYSLIAKSNILVSLHRSEGFGLCIAEAMMLKTPVVATNWSANIEFSQNHRFNVAYKLVSVNDPDELSSYTYRVDPKWADSDLEDAGEKVKLLLDNSDIARKYAESLYNDIVSYFNSSKSFAAQVKVALKSICS